MFSVKQPLHRFYHNVIVPPINWVNSHTQLITVVAVGILLAASCYTSPAALELMKRNIKFFSILLPIACTLPAPVIGASLVVAEAVGYPGTVLFNSYMQTVAKAWQMWFTFVGIA